MNKPNFILLLILLIAFPCSNFAQENLDFVGQLSYEKSVNDLWGYVDENDQEYAIVGVQNGVSIVDLSDAENPVELHFVNGTGTNWRDIKTFDHYAYVVNEATAGGGLLIIDLENLPASIEHKNTDLGINYTDSHNIFIDENGVGYIMGASYSTPNGVAEGTIMIDIASDPWNPSFLGVYSNYYVHDGYVRDNEFYTCDIYDGNFRILDVAQKNSVEILAAQETPNKFSHSCWLNDAGDILYTADEVSGAWVVSYDISDKTDIKEKDRYRVEPGNVVPHNVTVKDDWLILSYYTAGVVIINASYPDILIEVGNFDTSPQTGSSTEGCWGVYPYLPSGKIIASDRQEGLFVLEPDYKEPCFIKGSVKNGETGNFLSNVEVSIPGFSQGDIMSNLLGKFKTGYLNDEPQMVIFSKEGFYPDTMVLDLEPGEMMELEIDLYPPSQCTSAPTALMASDPSNQEALISWSNNVNYLNYNLRYRIEGNQNWQILNSIGASPYNLEGLMNGENYEIQIQGICNPNPEQSVFSNSAFFSTSNCNSNFANAGEDQAACAGAEIQLNASGGISYQWSPTIGLNDSQIANPILTVSNNDLTYQVTVIDENGCEEIDEIFIQAFTNPDCLCTSQVGELTSSNISSCVGNSISVDYNNQLEVLDNDDNQTFILTNNADFFASTLYLASENGTFEFDENLTTNQTYFVFAVVGNVNTENNLPDNNDPCLSVSNPIEVIWNDMPEVSFNIENEICGMTIFLSVEQDNGDGYWSIQNPGVLINDKNEKSTTAFVSLPGWYMFTWNATLNSCETPFNYEINVFFEPESLAITCTNDQTNIDFEWNPIANTSNYLINAYVNDLLLEEVEVTETNYQISQLNNGDQAYITVEALTNNICGNAIEESMPCSIQNCDQNPIFNSLETNYCQNDGIINLADWVSPTGCNFTLNGEPITQIDLSMTYESGNPYTLNIQYLDEPTGCNYTLEHMFFVEEVPVVDFSISALEIDKEEILVIEYLGEVSDKYSYNWDFAGANVNPLGDQKYEISWTDSGIKYISLNLIKTDGLIGDQCLANDFGKTVKVKDGQSITLHCKLMLEGFYDSDLGKMRTDLVKNGLLPMEQPFDNEIFNYDGSENLENLITVPEDIVDWVYVELIDPNKPDEVFKKLALLVKDDGQLVDISLSAYIIIINIDGIDDLAFNIRLYHKNHLAIETAEPVSLSEGNLLDFSEGLVETKGEDQLKMIDGIHMLHSGDLDGNHIINSLDYNIWKQDNALVNKYVPWDMDGNGVVNSLDFNLWYNNRSKVGAIE